MPTLENGGVSEDLTIVTWKLRPDVLWSDGTPFTSADVKHTWEAARDAANGSAVASEYELITDVQTPDPETVVVSYSAFNAGYLDQFPWIVPQHATGASEEIATWDFNRNPIGTGPFVLQEWTPGEFLATVRIENYREEGKPYLGGLNFLVVPAKEARTARMIQGDGPPTWRRWKRNSASMIRSRCSTARGCLACCRATSAWQSLPNVR